MRTLISAILVAVSVVALAGPKVKSGDLKNLKDAKSIKVEFDFSSMMVQKGLGKKSLVAVDEYTSTKVSELNEKEAGKGDKWKKDWDMGLDSLYPAFFLQLANEVGEKTGRSFSTEGDAEYVCVVTTKRMSPGWNIGVSKQPAFCDFVFTFYKVVDGKKEELCVIEYLNSIGSQAMGYDFKSSDRIKESYAKGAKSLVKLLNKKAWKK